MLKIITGSSEIKNISVPKFAIR